jgi:pyruvate/2-oxoglutarate dehydrogenase complex dihydrolipoamide dehydrogenase (E3) component
LTNGGTRQISAPVIVIDAGTRPKPLAIAGAGEVTVLDSTSIMELDELPEHLIILGGGYIGLEFGQMFRRLGSEVTIIQKRRSPADDRGRGRLGRGRRDLAR